jgi:Fe-S cluster assembly protein SufD
MAVEVAHIEGYLNAFTEFRKESASETPRWLSDLQDTGFARFCKTGFPTIRDEDWRFTNLSPVARTPFVLAPESRRRVARFDRQKWQIKDALQLAFLDGRFRPELSNLSAIPRGLTLNSLHSEINQGAAHAREHLGRYLNIDRDPFCALNTAFAQDGAYVHVRRGLALERPIHLLFISTSGDRPAMTHPRNLILMEDESEAAIVEEYVSIGEAIPTLSNAVTELVAGSNSTVAHTLIEREHLQSYNFSTLRIEQARSANVASHSLLLGGALVRNNVHPVLAGEGGECLINGLFVGDGSQHLDNYMLVEHASPHCASRQFYNGILDERAHGVFHGRIIVHKDAQKTDAKQTNRNLLLADDAQIDTKPQLEIHADDVKCTHGATIGQIDEDALFYLRSRGIGEAEARRILLQAFAAECLDRMKPGVARDYCEVLITERLALIASASSQHREAVQGSRERGWKEVG